MVLRAYLEAKIEHAQLLLNAYNSFVKVTILSALTRPDYVSQDIQIKINKYNVVLNVSFVDQFLAL